MLPYLISSRLRRQLLTHYFTHPEEKYYVREIASLLNLDAGNLSRELRSLARIGVFEEERKGRIKFYRLNLGWPLYDEVKKIVFKTAGIEGSLRGIMSGIPGIKLAFIYGSYAKGMEQASSDIDLLIVGDSNRKHLTSKIRELENRIQREINFNVYTEKEFTEKSREKGSFLAEVLEDKKILLKGTLHD